MGYAATQVVVYGIKVSSAEALSIAREIEARVLASDGITPKESKQLRNRSISIEDVLDRAGIYHALALCAPGADGRVENCDWYDGARSGGYVFGYRIAKNGYGASDDIANAIREGPPSFVSKEWKTAMEPMLAKLGIAGSADVLTLNQIH